MTYEWHAATHREVEDDELGERAQLQHLAHVRHLVVAQIQLEQRRHLAELSKSGSRSQLRAYIGLI